MRVPHKYGLPAALKRYDLMVAKDKLQPTLDLICIPRAPILHTMPTKNMLPAPSTRPFWAHAGVHFWIGFKKC